MNNNKFEISFLSLSLVISAWLVFSSFTFINKETVSNAQIKYSFGFSLQPTYNSGLVSYWLVGEQGGNIVYKYPLSVNNFILQMKGMQRSGANQVGNNLFEKNGLDVCFYEYYWDMDKYGPLQCFRLDDLWALRYNRNPMCPEGCLVAEGMKLNGWAANKAKPNAAQMAILKTYGIKSFQDIIYGEQMFSLWKDMRNEDWQNKYSSAQ